MELVLIRHGESEANVFGKMGIFYCGRWDCNLSAKGKMQAGRLKGTSFVNGADAVFCSPLKRTIDTASAFVEGTIIRDTRITERSLGDFEGKWKYELEDRPEYQKYFVDPQFTWFRESFTVAAPNGETYSDVLERVTLFLEELEKRKYKKVVIVSHKVAIRCMIKAVRNLSETETFGLTIANCEPICLNHT